jgi:ABC-type dipeptide/oligopeptide/nickel transport system permease subunit
LPCKAILAEASLSDLGLGVQEPVPARGLMV